MPMYIINLKLINLYTQLFKQWENSKYIFSWPPGEHMTATQLHWIRRQRKRINLVMEYKMQDQTSSGLRALILQSPPALVSASLQKSVPSCLLHTNSFHSVGTMAALASSLSSFSNMVDYLQIFLP